MRWTHFGTVIASEPRLMNKEGKFEYAAIRIARDGHQLCYAPGFITVSERLKASLHPRFVQEEQLFSSIQYINAGQSFAHFAPLFAYVALEDSSWVSQAVQLTKRAG